MLKTPKSFIPLSFLQIEGGEAKVPYCSARISQPLSDDLRDKRCAAPRRANSRLSATAAAGERKSDKVREAGEDDQSMAQRSCASFKLLCQVKFKVWNLKMLPIYLLSSSHSAKLCYQSLIYYFLCFMLCIHPENSF